MNYIIYDLEHLAARHEREPKSIIELGAIKVNESLCVVDHFHSLIRPSLFSPKSYKLTNRITNIDFDTLLPSPTFKQVISEFLHWISYPHTNDYYLCTWGNTDVQILFEECGRSKVSPYWIMNNNDIQVEISLNLTKLELNRISLISAVQKTFNIDSFEEHTAISDAWMTSLLFIEHYNILKLRKNTFDRSKTNTPVYREKFSNKPFSKLKNLLPTE